MHLFSIFRKDKAPAAIFEFPLGDRIWPHVSLSHKQYEQTYLESLRRFAIDNPTEDALKLAEFSLRARRAYIIPAGVAPEEDYLTRDKWTYVCFIMSLACSIGYVADSNNARLWMIKIVPEYILRWLGRDVGFTLVRTIQGNYSDSFQLKEIMDYSIETTDFVFSNTDDPSPSDEDQTIGLDKSPIIVEKEVQKSRYGKTASLLLDRITNDIITKKVTVNFATASIHVVYGGFIVYLNYVEEFAAGLEKPINGKTCARKLLSDGVAFHRYRLLNSKKEILIESYFLESDLPVQLNLARSEGLVRVFPSL